MKEDFEAVSACLYIIEDPCNT